MFGLSFQELVIVGIVAILLFGKRLPEVAKTLGSRYREFRKGLAEVQSSFNMSDYSLRTMTSQALSSPSKTPAASSGSYSEYDDYDEPTAPKFAPPPSEPQQAASGEIASQQPHD